MASVKKFDESAVVNQLRHIERTIQNPENKDICKERTVENYSLAPQRGISSYDYYVERKKELYCYNRKDVKVMAGWIVTVPKNLKESDRERFFQVTYEFLLNDMGKETAYRQLYIMTRVVNHICIFCLFRPHRIRNMVVKKYVRMMY